MDHAPYQKPDDKSVSSDALGRSILYIFFYRSFHLELKFQTPRHQHSAFDIDQCRASWHEIHNWNNESLHREDESSRIHRGLRFVERFQWFHTMELFHHRLDYHITQCGRHSLPEL